MRYVNLYLVGWIVFVLGVVLAMWKSGILREIAPVWIGIGIVIALGIGIMMSVGSGKPTITNE
jgi:hypothetical protein